MAKRVGNIYLPNCNYTCLYNAYRKAAKGKRYRGDVLQFTDNLEGNLLALLDDLKNHTYTVGAYREFYVYEPKKRLIMALPFRDRVAQWWVYSLLYPIFDKTFIEDSYKGTFPRGTKMDYSWPWCACTWSAAAIKLGYTPIMPIEISCYYLIEAAKKKGIWIENDAHVPKVGEGVLYYWKDGMNFATTDCTGVPDHVGTVTEVYEKAGYFVVTEGNYSNAVKKRTMLINGRYIRGFISPKYTDDTVTPVTPAAGKDLTTVAREVILGIWGNMPERKTKLEANGYNFTDVQNKVNELLNKNVPTPSKPQNTGVTKVVAGSGAASFDKSLAGSYVTTTGLYMRHGAGKNKRAMVLIPEGTKVQNYGYYTSYNGTKWLYIQVTLNGVQYTGFSCKTYLKKQ